MTVENTGNHMHQKHRK